jgi:hypothetical protein
MATDICSKFDAAFRNVSAYALIFDGKAVGRVVVKYGNAATAYVQVWGVPMTTARATGYGYDKESAAVIDAIKRFSPSEAPADAAGALAWMRARSTAAAWSGSANWRNALEAAGFTVATVI